MNSQLVKELRKYCIELKEYGGWWNNQLSCKIKVAADTIESLYANLESKNMEHFDNYCEDKWIPCNYKMPDKNGKYWITYFWGSKECVEMSKFEDGKFEFAVNVKTDVVAWKPCIFPKPYRQ